MSVKHERRMLEGLTKLTPLIVEMIESQARTVPAFEQTRAILVVDARSRTGRNFAAEVLGHTPSGESPACVAVVDISFLHHAFADQPFVVQVLGTPREGHVHVVGVGAGSAGSSPGSFQYRLARTPTACTDPRRAPSHAA